MTARHRTVLFWPAASVLFHLHDIPFFCLPVQADPSCSWRVGCHPSVNLFGDSFQVKVAGGGDTSWPPPPRGQLARRGGGNPGGKAAASSSRSPERARAQSPFRGSFPCRPRQQSWEPLGVGEPRLRPRRALVEQQSGDAQPVRREVSQALTCVPVNWHKGGMKCAPSLILTFSIWRGQQSG